MTEKNQTNENVDDKSHSPLEQQANLRDIDYCFGLFLNRLRDQEAGGCEPAEFDTVGEIYASFDAAISFDDKSQLIALLRRQVPIPHEFLILLADVMDGKFKPRGRSKILSHGQEIWFYIQMCKVQESIDRPNLEDMFIDFSEDVLTKGYEGSPDTFKRVWKNCEKDPWLKQTFGGGGKR
jgi:hypothetical protein